ncbi:MAG: hypothetical protein K8I30_09240 [Anaerolineae bacterium]|nr:hypothetical protein [Anaerolineae bacterium]
MPIRPLFRLISLLSIGFILAACGRTSAPATSLPLTQAFTSADGTITLNYPDKWVAQDVMTQVTIATSQTVLDADKPPAGQFQARLFGTPINAMQGVKEGATPREVLQFVAETLSSSGVTFSTPTDLMIGTRSAARVEGSGTDGQAVVLAVDLGGGNYVFATGASAPVEIARFEPTFLAMLESLTYTPLVAPVPESTP